MFRCFSIRLTSLPQFALLSMLGLLGVSVAHAQTGKMLVLPTAWANQEEVELLPLSAEFDQFMFDPDTAYQDSYVVPHEGGTEEIVVHQRPMSETWGWTIMPPDLLWHSYLAGPHEPRISSVIFADSDHGFFWDAALGGRVGLLRYGTTDSRPPQGWQWDLEGAVITRLDNHHAEDVESMDYRFGTEITRAEGPWSAKFGYFHVSSHVGDEYVVRNPTYQRRNYVTESLVLGLSYQADVSLRLYGESAYAFHRAGGAKPFQFQTGAEYSPLIARPASGGPFTALNLDIRESVHFDPALNLQTGWQWLSNQSGRRLRLGLQYYNGYSTQFQFFRQSSESLGVGTWFDY